MKRPFYAYSLFNEAVYLEHGYSFWGVSALLNVSISRFKKTKGCTTGNTISLSNSDIGKFFDIKILDPFIIGKGKLLGFGYDCLPNSKFKSALEKYRSYIDKMFLLVFHIKKNGKDIFLLVKRSECDATLIKGRRK